MVKVHKRPSKRIPLKTRHTIAKKVARKRTQAKRDAKKLGPDDRKKLRKDPGIPNLYPFKEELLHQIEGHKARILAEKEKQKELRRRSVEKARNMTATLERAAQREKEFEEKAAAKAREEAMADSKGEKKDLSLRQFHKKFKHVIDSADVILEVLDARDPLGCRCYEAEKTISALPKKRVILVLNKIDLVPREVVDQWVKYLRDEHPTVAFRCATQHSGIGGGPRPKQEGHGAVECLGGATLLQLLKNYCRPHDTPIDKEVSDGTSGKKAPKLGITVGIIGYPNVGKSSLINSLKHARAVSVSSQPGHTKEVSEVKLDKDITLLDSPGIVFDPEAGAASLALRSVVKVEQLEEPTEAVELLLSRVKKDVLMQRYRIPQFEGAQEFLVQIAKRRGLLRKGGVPNIPQAAKAVISDFTSGKIPFWSEPPKREGVHVGASIVTQFGPDLDLDAANSSIISTLADKIFPVADDSPAAVDEDMTAEEPIALDDDESDDAHRQDDEPIEELDGEAMEEDETDDANEEEMEEEDTVQPAPKAATYGDPHLNPRINQSRAKDIKKLQKKQKKEARRADTGSSTAPPKDDAYSFSDFFMR